MYFEKTRELLFERSFLKFVQKINKAFITIDLGQATVDAFSLDGETFQLTIQEWLRKCDPPKAKMKSMVASESFKDYAISWAKRFVSQDTDKFEVEHKKANSKIRNKIITDFLQEIEEVKLEIQQKDYLAPIKIEINNELLLIAKQFNEVLSSNKNSRGMAQEKEPTTKLIWNGGVSTIGTLFHDLRTTRPKNSRKVYLDYLPDELVKFVLDHFVDIDGNRFPESSLATYLNPKRMDKKAKRDKINITKLDEENE